jgi:hypothetical protein
VSDEPSVPADVTTADPTTEEDELLREAARLRGDLLDPEATERLSFTDPEPIPSEPERTRSFDPGAMLVGIWFVVAGLLGATLGGNVLDDLPPVIVPVSFAVVGLGLLLPKRTRLADRSVGDTYTSR